jgi:type II secretory pathway pseudopilin PulG
MVIVLAVVGTLLALAVPAMRRSLAKSELNDAAGQLRVVLAKARLKAIESGAVQTFCYQPGTGRFVVVSHDAPRAEQGAEPPPEEESLDEMATQELAGDIVFLDPDDEDSIPTLDDQPSQSEDNRIHVVQAEELDYDLVSTESSEWSKPVVFYPSGRASDAQFRLLGQFDYYVDVNLRGLTGTITLGQLQRPKPKEELEEEKQEDELKEPEPQPEVPEVMPSMPEASPPMPEVAADPAEPPPATPDEERQP